MAARVVTVAQQKGGAGKTTLTAQLAVALASAGRRVGLIDGDPQESLSAWYWLRREALAEDHDRIVLQGATGLRAAAVIDRMRRDNDVLVVDSPPHTRSAAKIAVAKADMVLIPVQLSPMDLWATRPTLEMAEQDGVPALLVLNRVPPRGRVPELVREAIKERKLPVARATLGNRLAFVSSLLDGKGVTETAPKSPAAAEIRALTREVTRRLARLG